MWQASHTYAPTEVADFVAMFERMIPVAEYPDLHEHGRQHLTDGPLHDVSAFELALDLILAGLEQLRLDGTG
jgi:hypothetical protein